MNETRPGQSQPQTTAAQLSAKQQSLTSREICLTRIPFLKLAMSSFLEMRIAMPFLSTSQQARTQTIVLLRRPRLSTPSFQRLIWAFQECPNLMTSHYMTLVSCMSREMLDELSHSFWSHLRPTSPFLSLSFLFALHFLVFSYPNSPLSFLQYECEPSVFIP